MCGDALCQMEDWRSGPDGIEESANFGARAVKSCDLSRQHRADALDRLRKFLAHT
jgi:hypothetical protein